MLTRHLEREFARRQQGRDVLAVLTKAVLASRTGDTPPSLLTAGA